VDHFENTKKIDTIQSQSDFLKECLSMGNRQAETSWSTLYVQMSSMGVFQKYKNKGSKIERETASDLAHLIRVSCGPDY
jgi:hypothetical protein